MPEYERERSRIRVDYLTDVEIKLSDNTIVSGMVHDISLNAIYILTDPVFQINDQVKIKIILRGRDSELNIKVPAKVVRTDKNGVALQFYNPLEWWPIFALFPMHNLGKELDISALHLDKKNRPPQVSQKENQAES